jgi:hypothetical protein
MYYAEDQFDFEDDTFTSIARSNEASGYIAIGIGSRWATGIRSDLWSSTYSNTRLARRLAWALEFDIFPYSESTRREFIILYTIGGSDFEYLEETLFDKTEESVSDHALTLSLDLKQLWGSVNTSLQGRQFLHDSDLNRLSASASLDVRLFRGLFLSLFGSYDAIRDQIYLAKRGATQEETLLRRKALATDFYFYTSASLSFTFGSVFNNTVNPRLLGFRRP